jgi:phospholipid/cholesterol/gamma-HCH transport system permease protein
MVASNPPPAISPERGRPPGYFPKTQSTWAGYVPALLFAPIELLGGMTLLGVRVVGSAVTRPVGYWRAVRDEMYYVPSA